MTPMTSRYLFRITVAALRITLYNKDIMMSLQRDRALRERGDRPHTQYLWDRRGSKTGATFSM